MTPFPPIDSTVLQAVLDTFEIVSRIVLGLTGAVFIARASLLVIQVEGAQAFSTLVRETIVLLLSLSIFPFVLKTLIAGTGQVAALIRFEAHSRSVGAIDGFIESIRTQLPLFGILADVGQLTLQHFVRAVFSLLVGLLAVATPLVFFSGYILGQGIGVAAIGSALLTLCLWPALWNIIGLFSSALWPSFQGTSLSSVVFSVVVTLLQFISPLFCLALLRQLSPQSALHSGMNVTSAISGRFR